MRISSGILRSLCTTARPKDFMLVIRWSLEPSISVHAYAAVCHHTERDVVVHAHIWSFSWNLSHHTRRNDGELCTS